MNMEQNKEKHLGFQIDAKIHAKLFRIAEYEGRTGNMQILSLIDSYIKEFECNHGPINLETQEANEK